MFYTMSWLQCLSLTSDGVDRSMCDLLAWVSSWRGLLAYNANIAFFAAVFL